QAIEVLVRAIGEMGAVDAWPTLIDKLRDPATPMGAIREIAGALVQLGARRAVPALREFLLEYRADPAFAADPTALQSVAEAIGKLGSAKDRELLKYVAEEPRTVDKLATYVRHELDQTRTGKLVEAAPAKGTATPAAVQTEPARPLKR